MKPNVENLPSVYLRPGEIYFSEHPTVVTTVLGSCVSLTMFNPRSKIGAICHALLPEGADTAVFRYVDGSIRHMLARFEACGIRRDQLEIKMFGGSDMLAMQSRGALSVGRRNVEIAGEVIQAEGLRLMAVDVGGDVGRKIFFYTHTGEVFMKRLRKGDGQQETFRGR